MEGCPDDCSGHGLCVDGTCHCDHGFAGVKCSAECAGAPNGIECSGHGACLSGKCYCLPGWSGDDCEWQACEYDCSAHGYCHNGTCSCIEGFKGKDCALPDAPAGCGCAISCVRTCLSKCSLMHEAHGKDAAHNCYQGCTAECHKGCAGEAELE